ncbi:mtDNA inheritance, partitioning of the mitochondrial organelle [Mortierella alpina]|uniref:MtDNA inheritance, partitioning of the mitochondrial organelle n=1 Tax=Mortierella alpina TaxID=64518 RepID=A0A9P6IRN6_MORAP|nr:mtDNA inheritance, partitioning of the mitochondrial organelle [Mortierella alpina]
MYYHRGQHHRVDDFTITTTPPQTSELRMYTWKNATLGEITTLVKQAIPTMIQDARAGSVLSFRHIFLDQNRGLFVGRDVGVVDIDSPRQLGSVEILDDSAEASMASQALQEKTLGSFNFVIGDYLDIAILPPTARSSQPQTSGGPMRNRGERFRRTGGGPGGAAGLVTDRFAGRLGGGIFSGNGHGQRPSKRRGQVGIDARIEPNWKSRGRGR